MCNAPNCNHTRDELDDSLEDIFGEGLVPAGEKVDDSLLQHQLANTRMFNVKCKACRGSGNFVGYSGRVVGACFKCKGKGTISTKTDPVVLQKRREQAAAKKAQKELEAAQLAMAWMEEHELEAAWLTAAASRGFEFATSLRESLLKWGKLTDGQLAAVRRCMEKDAARNAQKAERIANAPKVDVSAVVETLERAHQNGLKRPKLRLAGFVISRAPDTGKWAGSLYVTSSEDAYLGRITDGAFVRTRECSDALEAEFLALCAQPLEAAIAYGRQTGVCACCGRELTDPVSVERGIGPICAQKFFGA